MNDDPPENNIGDVPPLSPVRDDPPQFINGKVPPLSQVCDDHPQSNKADVPSLSQVYDNPPKFNIQPGDEAAQRRDLKRELTTTCRKEPE